MKRKRERKKTSEMNHTPKCVSRCVHFGHQHLYMGIKMATAASFCFDFFSRFFYFNNSAVILLFAYNNWVRCSMENKKNRYDSEMQLNILAQQRIPINQTSFFWSRAREPSANETQTNHIQWEREREGERRMGCKEIHTHRENTVKGKRFDWNQRFSKQ